MRRFARNLRLKKRRRKENVKKRSVRRGKKESDA